MSAVIAIAVKHMLAAGMDSEVIVEAVSEMEASLTPQRSSGAERTRRWRERHKASQSVTPVTCDAPSPPKESFPQTPFKEITPSPSSSLRSDVRSIDHAFEELPLPGFLDRSKPQEPPDDGFGAFWAAYPARDGPNPRKPSHQSYSRALKRGATAELLLAEVKHLAEQHPQPTRFVPRATTWLNEDRWKREDPRGPPESEPVRFRTVDEIMAERRDNGGKSVSG